MNRTSDFLKTPRILNVLLIVMITSKLANASYLGYAHYEQSSGYHFSQVTDPDCLNAQVYAGDDVTSCGYEGVLVSASAENYTDLDWQTSGSGTFSDPTGLSTLYFPSSSDIDNKMLVLCITAHAAPPCQDATDCVILFLFPAPRLISTTPGDGSITINWNANEIQCEALPELPPIEDKLSDFGWDIYINSLTIDGMDVVAGDELAIFDGDYLVGKTVLEGPVPPNQFGALLFAYCYLGMQPGYSIGAPFSFALCSSSAGVVLTSCTYQFDTEICGDNSYSGSTFPYPDTYSCIDLNFNGGVEKKFNIYVNNQLHAEDITGSVFTIEGLENNTQYCLSVKEKFYNDILSCKSNTLCDTPTASGIMKTLTLNLEQGWSGVSCYLDPLNSEMEQIFSGLQNELIIIQNLKGDFYQPFQESELTNWNFAEGYFIKMSGTENLEIIGFEPESKSITLQAGWNLIPVLCESEIEITVLFDSNLQYLEILKEAAGLLLYWPEMEISTLGNLLPGKSYLVKMNQAATITFN